MPCDNATNPRVMPQEGQGSPVARRNRQSTGLSGADGSSIETSSTSAVNAPATAARLLGDQHGAIIPFHTPRKEYAATMDFPF